MTANSTTIDAYFDIEMSVYLFNCLKPNHSFSNLKKSSMNPRWNLILSLLSIFSKNSLINFSYAFLTFFKLVLHEMNVIGSLTLILTFLYGVTAGGLAAYAAKYKAAKTTITENTQKAKTGLIDEGVIKENSQPTSVKTKGYTIKKVVIDGKEKYIKIPNKITIFKNKVRLKMSKTFSYIWKIRHIY